MIALLIIFGTIYLVGGILWAVNFAMDWSEANSRHGNQDAREAQEAARKFLATPVWPLIVFNNTVKMVRKMKETI